MGYVYFFSILYTFIGFCVGCGIFTSTSKISHKQEIFAAVACGPVWWVLGTICLACIGIEKLWKSLA